MHELMIGSRIIQDKFQIAAKGMWITLTKENIHDLLNKYYPADHLMKNNICENFEEFEDNKNG